MSLPLLLNPPVSPTDIEQRWEILPIPDDPAESSIVIRLNALGSLYFFTNFVLRRDRLVQHLHEPIARTLERRNVNYLLEMPRDHFKSTLATEALPIWWALPFDERDEAMMRELGYGDAWISWMKWAHDPQIRTLLISAAGHNTMKLGIRIDEHFTNNARFINTFPEIIPDEKCIWNTETKHIKHTGFHAHGEGTFDCIGVGGALQSRHYDRMIEDDLVGREAAKSEIIMNDVIEYHRLLEGAFDGPNRTEIVVGNRWSPWDLNWWIRENERKEFIIESHSALGGCCDLHPPGLPIFPEEFTIERLERIRRRQGPYLFSHQYLNEAIMPEEVVFKPEWLRFYSPVKAPSSVAGAAQRHWLAHEEVAGTAVKDLNPNGLIRSMIVDPNHAGEEGRARHAIVVVGYHQESDRVYLLDLWAASRSFDELFVNIWAMGTKWGLGEFWLETIAAQKILKFYIEYRNKVEQRHMSVRELKSQRSKNAKWDRIDALAPLFEQGKFYARHDQSAFLDEYYRYSHSTKHTVDILDCLGYAPQTFAPIRAKELLKLQEERKSRIMNRKGAY